MVNITKRITLDAMLLALLCIIGMFSIPLGDNVKVSLQFLGVIIIFGIVDKFIDKFLIVSLYLLIGLFLPVYAGFSTGITPTFGFVIGFVISAPIFHLIYLIKFRLPGFQFYLAATLSLIVTYISGSIFLARYLSMEYIPSLMISVLPYIPFDIIKIVVGGYIVKRINSIKSKQYHS